MSHTHYTLRNHTHDELFRFYRDDSGVIRQMVVQFVNPRMNIQALGFQVPETLARDIASETVDVSVDLENSRATFKNGLGFKISTETARRLWETLVVMGWNREE